MIFSTNLTSEANSLYAAEELRLLRAWEAARIEVARAEEKARRADADATSILPIMATADRREKEAWQAICAFRERTA